MHRWRVSLFITLLLVSVVVCGSEPKPERNYFRQMLTKSYDLQSALETWHFDHTPAKPATDPRFRNLVPNDARNSQQLPRQGFVLGEYLEAEPIPHQAIHFLVNNGVPNANWHIGAAVHLMSEGYDEQGYWCLLVSEDDYWTNSHNRDTFDFGMRLDSDGTIRLINPTQVGPSRRVANPAVKRR